MKDKGFTLVELLAVIVILAIVLAIAVPGVSGIINSATASAFGSDAKAVLRQLQLEKIDNRSFNIPATNLATLESIDISTNNYESILAGMTGKSIYVYIVGKNKWAGLKACGTHENMIVTKENECDTYANALSTMTFLGEDSDENLDYYDIASTSDGYVVVGRTYPEGSWAAIAVIKKYDLNGKMVWERTYDGTEYDRFESVAVASDGYIAVGQSESYDGDLTGLNIGNGDAIIVKYDLNGNVVWKKNYGGTYYDSFSDVVAVADGYVAIGEVVTDTDTDAVIVKYDLNGNILWERTYNVTEYDYFSRIASTIDGYVVVGENSTTNDSNAIIVKYSLTGDVLWSKEYGGTDYEFFGGIVSLGNGYAAIGSSYSTDGDLTGLNKGGCDAIIVKYDLNGNVVWKKNYGGNDYDAFYSMIATSNGIIAGGYSGSSDGDLIGLNTNLMSGVIAKFDLSGNVLWDNVYGDRYIIVTGLTATSDKNIGATLIYD